MTEMSILLRSPSLTRHSVIPAEAGIQEKDWIPGQARNDKARQVSIQLWTD